MSRAALLLSILAVTTFFGCASDPQTLPERDLQVTQHHPDQGPGMKLMELGRLIDYWRQEKARVPRTPHVEHREELLRGQLVDFATREQDFLIQTLLTSETARRRNRAAVGLGFSGTKAALEALLTALETEKDTTSKSEVVVGLGILADRDTPLAPLIDLIVQGGEAEDPISLRIAAAFAILRIVQNGGGTPADGERMLQAIADPDFRVRSQIALAASFPSVRTSETGKAIMRVLRDENPRVVAAACKGLGMMKLEEATSELIYVLDQPDESAQLAAREALREIHERDLGASAEAWKQWLRMKQQQEGL